MLTEDFENADNYFVIGFTGSGNGICIEIDTGRIVWVDADEGGIYFINSSLGQLYQCMQSYAEFIKETIEYTEEAINLLEEKLKGIDEIAVEIDEDKDIWPFWAEEIDGLYEKSE